MELTLFQKCVFEFLGTFILILMGDGVCANVSLNKSKAKGAGWVVVAIAWGLAVMMSPPQSRSQRRSGTGRQVRLVKCPALLRSPTPRRILRSRAGVHIL